MRKWLIALLMLIGASAYAATAVYHVAIRKQDKHWQLVIKSVGAYHYHSFFLSHPRRLVLDLYDAYLRDPVHMTAFKGSPIIAVKTTEYASDHVLRFIFNLNDKVNLRGSVEQNNGVGYSLFYNLYYHRGIPFTYSTQLLPPKSPAIASSALSKVALSHLNKQLEDRRSRNVVIVIDPGHGGKDPGTTGPGGTHEKTVVLAIGKDLATDINRVSGFEAALTRTGDYYVSLRGRLKIARNYHADMFLSVHADAFRVKSAQGASIYALSLRGATSEAARWVARRENASELRGGIDLNNKSHTLKSILVNMSQTATIATSIAIGQAILSRVGKVAKLHYGDRVEQAAFVVLKSPDIPSLLIETGFLSNPVEEAKLKNPLFQHKLAQAIATGIIAYFRTHPPRGTWLAMSQ